MDPRLYRAAKSGDISFLSTLLNDNPSLLHQVTPRENTALHIAVQFGQPRVVSEIYTRCRSLLTHPNLDGDTSLHVAARVGCFSIFNYLVREILSASQEDFSNTNCGMFETLSIRNRRNNTVLHEAVRSGHNQVVDLLLKTDPLLACYENEAGESPLYLAARGGMFEILNRILESTSSSAHGGLDGQTALHAAVIEKHFDIMEMILRFKQHLIKEVDHQGKTALYYAASLGDHKTVRRLLQLDTCIAYVSDKEGHSPIHVAASKGHTRVIREIIRHCPDSGELTNSYGQNALHVAILGGQTNVVRYVLETTELEGLLNQADVDGNTPLHLAMIQPKSWIVCYLMWDVRVDQRLKNKCGQTPFQIESSNTSHRNIIPNNEISSKAMQEESCNDVQSYMQMGQTLLMVTTLIATVTFAAAFTMPGGYNNNVGEHQGEALLQSNKYFKTFIISDTIAMVFSINAACLLFWGAVNSNEASYFYYFTAASVLTFIALQSTAVAFKNGVLAVLPHHQYFFILSDVVGAAFHISTFLLLTQLVKMFSIPQACTFFISHLCKLNYRIRNKQ